jgi:pyruvate/2-oxoglutarate dehydrogenase complex dihydrolipoamide acyltransferase (E2) component
MPLFRRPDGELVRGESAVRRAMPYLMPGRNESAVFHDTVFRIAAARAWLRAYNRSHAHRATLFHLLAYACGVALRARPRLNRFVSGGRIYQRRGVTLSFVTKMEFTDEGADATVKLDALEGDSLADFSARIAAHLADAHGKRRAVDREVELAMRLPGPVVRFLFGLVRLLDRWNLLPGFMMKHDPMYASLFLANLGSVGVSDVFHHLYEYGTVSIFAAMSAPRRAPFVVDGQLVIEDGLAVRWTFDERIDDAFSCARSLALVQDILEEPHRHLGQPDGDAVWSPAA